MSFESVKSIIGDCICKTVNFVGAKISESPLNLLANEYADKVIKEFSKEQWEKEFEVIEDANDGFDFSPTIIAVCKWLDLRAGLKLKIKARKGKIVIEKVNE